jgi:hypothetical protein
MERQHHEGERSVSGNKKSFIDLMNDPAFKQQQQQARERQPRRRVRDINVAAQPKKRNSK